MILELTKDFLDQIKDSVHDRDDDFIRDSMEGLHAADIDSILYELNTKEAKYVIDLLDFEIQAEIISGLEEEIQSRFLKNFSSEHLARLIEFIDSDDAADILNERSIGVKQEVLNALSSQEKVNDLLELMRYDEDVAGGLMAKELIRANENWTVTQCIEEIRRQVEDVERVYSVYVVDDSDKLLGRVPLKELLLSSAKKVVKDVCDTDILSINVFAREEEVAETMSKYDLVAIPVVDLQGRLVGRITIDDVVDVIHEQAEFEKQLMSGITENVEHVDNIFTLTRARLPWLIIGLAGGLVGAQLIGVFEGVLEEVKAIAFFIPLIMATGGNVGIQSSSIIVQSLANKTVSRGVGRELAKSFLVSILNGAALAVLTFGFLYFVGSMPGMGLAVAVSLFCVVVLASLMGTVTPIVLDRFGINPALASGPFITTANDILGIVVYFYVVKVFLGI